MTDTPHVPDHSDIPDAVVERRLRRSSQLIWIIPILAAIIGISLAVKSYLDRGPVITITFRSGEGIEAGKTKIKYKDVQIGLVRAITIAKDRSHVVVTAELSKEAEGLLVEDTRFWVVRARISGDSSLRSSLRHAADHGRDAHVAASTVRIMLFVSTIQALSVAASSHRSRLLRARSASAPRSDDAAAARPVSGRSRKLKFAIASSYSAAGSSECPM